MERRAESPRIVGVLLAAGRGARFGGDKLLARMPHGHGDVAAGTPVAIAACRHLLAALPDSVAVVRADDARLIEALRQTGIRILPFANADDGMGASLGYGVAQTAGAAGWVIALADMPWIDASTIQVVVRALEQGTLLAAPVHAGVRGHPVGFGAGLQADLVALRGDEGARRVLHTRVRDLVQLAVDDPGILRDVDTPEDLAGA